MTEICLQLTVSWVTYVDIQFWFPLDEIHGVSEFKVLSSYWVLTDGPYKGTLMGFKEEIQL